MRHVHVRLIIDRTSILPDAACLPGQFDCTGTGTGNGTSCINSNLVCNGVADCPVNPSPTGVSTEEVFCGTVHGAVEMHPIYIYAACSSDY